MCVFGGFLTYMQLGAALMLHANVQPYVLPVFFNPTSDLTLNGINGFTQTYGVWCLNMICMLLGLLLGKRVLIRSVRRSTAGCCGEVTPRAIVFVCCALQVCLLLCIRQVLLKTQRDEVPASTGFVAYALLFGGLNGLLVGVCYQAPLFAAQMYFPDRKPLIRTILLFGSTLGIITYSLLTTFWANQSAETPAARMMLRLAVCFSFHAAIGSLLLTTPTQSFVKKGDKRALQFSLLNTYESEDEPRRTPA